MKISPQCSCAFHPPPSQGTWNHPSPSTQPCICFENLKFSICFEMFPPTIFFKVLLFVLKCFSRAFFIKFHWTQHVFENTFKNDNDATLPVWKKEKSSKTDARTVCNCNFKNNLCTLTMCIFVGQQFAAMRGTSMFPPVGCLAFPSHTNRGSRPALCTGRCYVST